jgi:hypothetical protein
LGSAAEYYAAIARGQATRSGAVHVRFPSSPELSHGFGARGGFGYQCGLIRQFRCHVLYPMSRRVQHFDNDCASGQVAPEM